MHRHEEGSPQPWSQLHEALRVALGFPPARCLAGCVSAPSAHPGAGSASAGGEGGEGGRIALIDRCACCT